MSPLDMQPLQASFTSQAQAEEAIRKLAALRANRFRMERGGTGTDFGSASANENATMNALANSLLYGGAEMEAGAELGQPADEQGAVFSLSVDVPAAASEQARQVISQAGGQIV